MFVTICLYLMGYIFLTTFTTVIAAAFVGKVATANALTVGVCLGTGLLWPLSLPMFAGFTLYILLRKVFT